MSPHERTLLTSLADQALKIMLRLGIHIRPFSLNMPAAVLPRITRLATSDKGHFKPGPEITMETLDLKHEIITCYPYAQLVLNEPTYDMLFCDETVDKQKHYLRSLVVHELTHFYQTVSVITGTSNDGYIHQKNDLEGYFTQRYEFDAYSVQAIYYHRNDFHSTISTIDLKAMINLMFAQENETLYRFKI